MALFLKHVSLRSLRMYKSTQFSRLAPCYSQELSVDTKKQQRKVFVDFNTSIKDTLPKVKKAYAKEVRPLEKCGRNYSKDLATFIPVYGYSSSLFINYKITIPTIYHKCCFSSDSSKDNSSLSNTNATDEKDKTSSDEKDRIKEKENILTIPNILTTSRILITPYLGYLVLQESFELACGIFVFAGLSDLLDGWIARNFKNQMSAFGSFLDPLADKLLISTLFVTLSISNVIPVPLTVLVISRDIGLIIAALVIRYMSLPRQHTFKQFCDATNPSAQLKPLFISKVNTAFQLTLIALSIAAPVFGYVDHAFLHFLWYTTAGSTVASGIGYLVVKDTYKISNNMNDNIKK